MVIVSLLKLKKKGIKISVAHTECALIKPPNNYTHSCDCQHV